MNIIIWLPLTIIGLIVFGLGLYFVEREARQRYEQALRRIAMNGVCGSAWCVAVAREALGQHKAGITR